MALALLAVSPWPTASAQPPATPRPAPPTLPTPPQSDLADERADPQGPSRPFRLGPADAPAQVIFFVDYQSPACGRVHRHLNRLRNEFGDRLSMTVRHFPLCTQCNHTLNSTTHPNACQAALAAEAAGMLAGGDAFWQLHEWLLEKEGSFTEEELIARLPGLGLNNTREFLETMRGPTPMRGIVGDVVEASLHGIAGVPAVLVNGRVLAGRNAETRLADRVSEAIRSREDLASDPLRAVDQAALAKGFPAPIQHMLAMATVRVMAGAGRASSSGVVVARRGRFAYLLTADHVLGLAKEVQIEWFPGTTQADSARPTRTAVVVARSSRADVAVARFSAQGGIGGLTPICPPTLIPVGESFTALSARAQGTERNATIRLETVLGSRHIRRRGRDKPGQVWEVENPIGSGASGGPLVDQRGMLIGIASGISQKKGYYSHIAELHRFLSEEQLGWLYGAQAPPPESTGEDR